MKKLFTFLLLSWLMIQPITTVNGQCPPTTTVEAYCLPSSNTAWAEITIHDSIPLGDSIHIEWSNGFEYWAMVPFPSVPYVINTATTTLIEGYYSVTITTDGGCSWVEDSLYYDCDLPGDCNPGLGRSFTCHPDDSVSFIFTLFEPFLIDSLVHFEWSNGVVKTVVLDSLSGWGIEDVAFGMENMPNGSYTVNVFTDAGCTWYEIPIEIDCHVSTVDPCIPPTSFNYECMPDSTVDITVALFDETYGDSSVTFIWSTGDTTYLDTIAPPFIYGSTLEGLPANETYSITAVTSGGCTWDYGPHDIQCYNHHGVECGPEFILDWACDGDSILLTAYVPDPSYVDSTANLLWSTLEVTQAAAIVFNGQAYLGGQLKVFDDGYYDVILETSGLCASKAYNYTIDCSEKCGQNIGYSFECTIDPSNQASTILTAVAWNVLDPPAVPFTFEWSTGDTTYAASYNGIYFTQLIGNNLPPIISVIVTDSVGCVRYDTIVVNCLWPGDTDLNGGVNHYDLLNVGLGFSVQGEERSGASLTWMPQEAPYWNNGTPVTATDYVYADTDGDGQVGSSDQQAIQFNWNETIADNILVVNARDLPPVGNEPIPFYVEGATVTEGQAYTFPVMLGTADVPVEDVYGLAFSILYNPDVIDADQIYTNFSNSWIGTLGDDLMAVQQNFPDEARLDIAITRTDGQPVSGFGAICDLEIIVIEDVIFIDDLEKELVENAFEITEALLINNLEEELAHDPMSTDLEVIDVTSSTVDLNPLLELSILPNPTNGECMVKSSENMGALTLYTPTGQKVLVKNITAKKDWLSLGHLPSGIYLLHIQTAKGIVVEKIHLLSGQ